MIKIVKSEVPKAEIKYASFLAVRLPRESTAGLLNFLREREQKIQSIPVHLKRVKGAGSTNKVLVVASEPAESAEGAKMEISIFLDAICVCHSFSTELVPADHPESKVGLSGDARDSLTDMADELCRNQRAHSSRAGAQWLLRSD